MSASEITIVGGGISGLSLGIGLRKQGVPVKLVEAGRFPRHRVCGEFISGVDDSTLEALHVSDLLADAELCRSTSWYDQSGPFFSTELPIPAFGISRYRLDQRMAERFVEAGGCLQEGTRYRETEPAAEGTVLATGRHRSGESQWIGLKAHLAGFQLEADLEMHLGNGGYLGISRIENNRVNVCGLFVRQSGLEVSRETALSSYLAAVGLGSLLERMKDAEFDPGSHIAVSAFELGRQQEKTTAIRVGDRHSIIGPFTGNGMSLAFQSSEAVLPFIRKFSFSEESWKETVSCSESVLGTLSRRRLAFSKAFHPFLTRSTGQRLMKVLAGRNMLPFGMMLRMLR